MINLVSRRGWLKTAAFTLPIAFVSSRLFGASMQKPDTRQEPLPDLFPAQPPELIREIVTVAHFDLKRVQDLVDARPSLARAAWDWGFGDWETPLGAASHMGNRPITEYLNGAPNHAGIIICRPNDLPPSPLWQKSVARQ